MSGTAPLTLESLVPPLGEYLIVKGHITRDDLDRALQLQTSLRQRGVNKSTGQILVDMGVITNEIRDGVLYELFLQMQSFLQDANRQLERRVKERTAELEKALEQLTTLNELKSNLVANISHELRTPMTHLTGYVDLLLNGDFGALTPDQKTALEVVQHSGARLDQLIEDLIQFSISERNQIYLHIQAVDLQELCASVYRRSQAKAIEHEVRFRLEMNDPGVKVGADLEKISWVLMQFVDNAVKFTPAGGTVILRTTREDGFIHLEVEDTGIGIPADRIGQIFDPFFQLDGGSTRKAGGTGLGLALARRIVEAHGSVIHAYSEEGKGSRFEFLLKIQAN